MTIVLCSKLGLEGSDGCGKLRISGIEKYMQ